MIRFALAVVLGLATGLSALAAAAHEFTAGDITVRHPWSRATPGRAPNGAVFLTLVNGGATADRLVAASSPVAARAGFHTTLREGEVMKMRPLQAIEVPAGGAATLAPGGLHIMLMGLKAPLRKGESFPLTLTFERAGTVVVEVVVEGPGARESKH